MMNNPAYHLPKIFAPNEVPPYLAKLTQVVSWETHQEWLLMIRQAPPVPLPTPEMFYAFVMGNTPVLPYTVVGHTWASPTYDIRTRAPATWPYLLVFFRYPDVHVN